MKKLYSQVIYGLGRNLREIFPLCAVSSLVLFGCSNAGLDGNTGLEELFPNSEITQFAIEITHSDSDTTGSGEYYTYYGNIEEKVVTIYIPDDIVPNRHRITLKEKEILSFPIDRNLAIYPLGDLEFSDNPSPDDPSLPEFFSSITVAWESNNIKDTYELILRLIQHPSRTQDESNNGDTVYHIFQKNQLTSDSEAIRAEVQSFQRYELMNPIVFSDTFNPIGNDSESFGGIFDGKGNTISNLNINGSADGSKGFFARISGSAVIRNLHLRSSDNPNMVVSTEGDVGFLAGRNQGLIENVSLKGNRTLTVDYRHNHPEDYGSGGLVGTNAVLGIIINSHVDGFDPSNPNRSIFLRTLNNTIENVGGLVGRNFGSIKDSSVTKVRLTGIGRYFGGLVGKNTDTIENSHATSVSVERSGDTKYFGGLVGGNYGEISKSSAEVDYLSGGDRLGGLVGINDNAASITESYAKSALVQASSHAGGLVGENKGIITSSYATGTINGSDAIGGLVGLHSDGAIRGSYADGYADGYSSTTNSAYIGLVGHSSTTTPIIISSYFNGLQNSLSVGGISQEEAAALSNVRGYFSRYGNVYRSDSEELYISQSDFVDDDPSDEYDMWNFDTTWHWIGDGAWPRLKWEYDE